MYSEEEVRAAIALLRIRKQEKHIPNLAGYFDERPRVGERRKGMREWLHSRGIGRVLVLLQRRILKES